MSRLVTVTDSNGDITTVIRAEDVSFATVDAAIVKVRFRGVDNHVTFNVGIHSKALELVRELAGAMEYV